MSQGVSGITNTVPLAAAVLITDAATTGRLSVVFSIAIFVQGAARSVGGQPLTLVDPAVVRGALARSALNSGLIAAVAIGLAAMVALASQGATRQLAIDLGASFPILIALDLGRHIQFTSGRARWAALADLLWLIMTCAAIFYWRAELDASRLYLAWAIGAIPAMVVTGIASSGLFPARERRRTRLAVFETRNLSSLFVDFAAGAGIAQLFFAVLAALASTAVLGQYRGVLLVFAPLPLIVMLLHVIWGPRVAAAISAGQDQATAVVSKANSIQLKLSGLWCLAALAGILVADSMTDPERYFGRAWPVSILFVGVGSILANISSMATVAIRAAARGAKLLQARVVTAAVQVVLVGTGGLLGETLTIAAGFLLSTIVNRRIWMSFADRAVEERIRLGGLVKTS